MVLKFVAVGAGITIVGTSVGAVVTDGFGYWKTIHWQPLSQDGGYYSAEAPKTVGNTYKGKFGETYGKYLTGLDKKNEAFWNNKYKLLEGDTTITSGKFQKEEKVKGGFIAEGNDSNKSLHKVCEDAYKETESTGFADNDTNKFKKSEVWKYCSPGTLVNLEEDKKVGEGTIGKNTSDKQLLSTTSRDNDWFWKIRNEDFWTAEGEWSGSKATGSDGNESLFKKEYVAKNANDDGTRKTIRELCEKAYQEQATSASSNNSTDAKRFCVLEKTGA